MNEDGLQFHEFADLQYTHGELRKLLEKLDKGELLTKEQYNKLINEIGLENISTFNLDYYELDNRPTIPVRVSQLFNDRNYDTVASVNIKVATLSDQVNADIQEINNTLGDLKLLDIATLLEELNETSVRMGEIQTSFEFTNQAIFSLERSVENNESYINLLNKNHEVLEKHQDDNVLLIENLTTVQGIHTEDIDNLNTLLNTYIDKQADLLHTVEQYQATVNSLKSNCDLINDKYNDFITKQMQEFEDGLAKLAGYKDIESINISISNLNRDLGLLSRELDQSILDLKNNDLKDLKNDLEGQILRVRNQIPTLTSQLFNDSDYVTFAQLGEEFLTREALDDVIISAGSVTMDAVDQKIRDELNRFSGFDSSSDTLINMLDQYVTDVELGEKNYATQRALEDFKLEAKDIIDKGIRDGLTNFVPSVGGNTNHKVLTMEEFNELDPAEQESQDIVHIIITDGESSGLIPLPPSSDTGSNPNPSPSPDIDLSGYVPLEQYNSLLERVRALEAAIETMITSFHDYPNN